MRRKSLHKAKLVVKVKSLKKKNEIITESVYDNRTKEYWSPEQIHERGIEYFLNMDDLKESLNWNLNGDESRFQFKWGFTGTDISYGCAYIFD